MADPNPANWRHNQGKTFTKEDILSPGVFKSYDTGELEAQQNLIDHPNMINNDANIGAYREFHDFVPEGFKNISPRLLGHPIDYSQYDQVELEQRVAYILQGFCPRETVSNEELTWLMMLYTDIESSTGITIRDQIATGLLINGVLPPYPDKEHLLDRFALQQPDSYDLTYKIPIRSQSMDKQTTLIETPEHPTYGLNLEFPDQLSPVCYANHKTQNQPLTEISQNCQNARPYSPDFSLDSVQPNCKTVMNTQNTLGYYRSEIVDPTEEYPPNQSITSSLEEGHSQAHGADNSVLVHTSYRDKISESGDNLAESISPLDLSYSTSNCGLSGGVRRTTFYPGTCFVEGGQYGALDLIYWEQNDYNNGPPPLIVIPTGDGQFVNGFFNSSMLEDPMARAYIYQMTRGVLVPKEIANDRASLRHYGVLSPVQCPSSEFVDLSTPEEDTPQSVSSIVDDATSQKPKPKKRNRKRDVIMVESVDDISTITNWTKLRNPSRIKLVSNEKKTFACQHSGCTRSYGRPGELRIHVKTHATEGAYCPLCQDYSEARRNKLWTIGYRLKEHLVYVHFGADRENTDIHDAMMLLMGPRAVHEYRSYNTCYDRSLERLKNGKMGRGNRSRKPWIFKSCGKMPQNAPRKTPVGGKIDVAEGREMIANTTSTYSTMHENCESPLATNFIENMDGNISDFSSINGCMIRSCENNIPNSNIPSVAKTTYRPMTRSAAKKQLDANEESNTLTFNSDDESGISKRRKTGQFAARN